MSPRLVALVLLAGCAPRRDPGAIPAEVVQEPVRLVTQPDAESPNIYLQAIIGAGSAQDPTGQEGLAHLTAQALVEAGAGARSADELREALYPTGNGLQLIVDKEWVSLRLRCHVDHTDLCIELFTDVLTAPRFDEADVIRLREEAAFAVSEGILGDEEALGEAVFHSVLYEGHPYAHPIAGRAGVLPTLDAADTKGFHDAFYVRSNMVVGVAGNVSTEATATLRERLEAVPGVAPPDMARMAPPSKEGRSLTVVSTGTPVTGFHAGHLVELDRNHPDWPALHLAMTTVGAHRQSFGRLFRTIRSDRGLNYGDYAYVEPYVQQGWSPAPENGVLRPTNHFYLWLRPTSTENGAFALKLALHELDALLETGLTQEEFDRTLSYLHGAVPLLARDPGRRLAFALDAEIMGVPNMLEALPASLDQLTLEQVNDALKRHLRPDDLTIVAVSGEADELARVLVAAEETPITYADVTPSEAQAAVDAEVAKRDVGLEEEDVVVVPAEGIFR